MAKSEQLKRVIFSRGVEAVARLFETDEEVYVCPLCTRGFGRSELERGDLTLEHVPPRSLGGRGIILTCRSCNSVAGHELENHSARRARQHDFARGVLGQEAGKGGSAFATLGGLRLAVDVLQRDGVLNVTVSTHNSPAAMEEGIRFMDRATGPNFEPIKFELSSRDDYLIRRAHAADLKAAFLGLTAALGYTYALNELSSIVRRQIGSPDEQIMPNWWGSSIEVPRPSICIVETDGIAVVAMPNATVILPWPSRQDDHWKTVISRRGPQTFKGRRWPWPTRFVGYLDFDESHRVGVVANE